MKKLIGILIALLAICLLLSVPAFATEATEGAASETTQTSLEQPTITAQNLAFVDRVHILFDLYIGDAESEGLEYGMIFWAEEKSDANDYKLENIGDDDTVVTGDKARDDRYDENSPYGAISVKVFDYSVAAKEMTDMVYAQGYIKNADGTYRYSEVKPYSVQTYAGNKLGINPGKTATDNEALGEMIKALLQFGTASQKYFKYHTDDLADTILNWSTGLAYTANSDGKTCYVSGIGTCAANALYIPKIALDGECAGMKVTGIGKSAFSKSKTLISVVIPNTVTQIEAGAFLSCGSLKSITIPSSVNAIVGNVFGNCGALESISVNAANAKYSSRDNCLIETSTKTLIAGCVSSVIPTDGSVTKIADRAFQGRTGLTAIKIPSTIEDISGYAFYGCSGVTSISVAPENNYYNSEGNCLIKTSDNTLIFGCATSVIPNSVTSIGENAFRDCTGLISITIPDSVTSIGMRAFYSCSGLTSVSMSGNVESIGTYAFYNCKKLATIDYDGTADQWDDLLGKSDWDGKTGGVTYTVLYKVDTPVIEGIMVYYQDFDTAATVDDLGWNKLDSSSVYGTGNACTTTYTLENKRLKVVGGSKESYTMIKDSSYMKAACLGDYTIQYDIEYTGGSARGYFNFVNNFVNSYKYNSVLFRLDGSADNQVCVNRADDNGWYDYDVPGAYDADGEDTDTTGQSVISKLTNNATTYVSGGKPMLNKNITVKIQVSHDNGMTVWARENSEGAEWICVSKTDKNSAGWQYWNSIDAYAICLKTRSGVTAYIDNIAIWTGLGDMPSDTTTTTYETAIAAK